MTIPSEYWRKLAGHDLLQMDSRCTSRLASFVGQRISELREPDQDATWVAARLRYLTEQWREDFFLLSELVESPIEQFFGGYLLCITDGYNEVTVDLMPGAFPDPQFGTYFRCQQQLYEYRADFMFKVVFRGDYRVLDVELDGHDFHERTKEQAARDRSRDRLLTSKGIQVIRFTGSEIYRNPERCAEDVEQQLARMTQDLLHEHGHETKPRRPIVRD